MTRIALNAEQMAKLNSGNGRAEFADEQGNVLGDLMTDASFDRIARRKSSISTRVFPRSSGWLKAISRTASSARTR